MFNNQVGNYTEIGIDIKVLQRKSLTNSRRNNNDSKKSNILRKRFEEEYTFDSQHDTFKHLLFIYIQSKPLPSLVYIRIDNPDDSANGPVIVRLQNFTKKKDKEVLSHTSRNTEREPANYVSPMHWFSLRLSFTLCGVLCSVVVAICCTSCNSMIVSCGS